MVYLLAIALFNTRANERISKNTKLMSEKMLEEISDELHNYYVNEMRIENYASRLAKIVKLEMESTDVRRQFKDVRKMIEVFDIFSVFSTTDSSVSPFCFDL
uniref:NR LBD domain-containing protein n=1 Tax=Steinernema glaseri TaxID=37863 RepID=A0A1I7Y697_9BILA